MKINNIMICITLCISFLSCLQAIYTNIPLERLPLEDDNQTISWTLAGVEEGATQSTNPSGIINVT